MFFGGEVIIFAAGTIALAVADRFAETHGFGKLERLVKVAFPIVAIGLAVYFMDVNPIIKWIGL